MSKKVSFNMTEENAKKIETLVGETNLSMTDVINQAIAKAKVIGVAEFKEIERNFCALRDLLENREMDTNIYKEVVKTCRYLNLLMEKIADQIS
ncbi:MAG: hypothetical protein MSR29_02655 [Lachnospiraceae bacterium]|nr:hypothetical protein [Lachnospiraceae bacterium]